MALLYEQIEEDLLKASEHQLRCTVCENSFPLAKGRCADFLANGWPKCCGYTMRLERVA
jgi:hypothetical protein